MANTTKKRLVDDLLILLTRFGLTDDSRLDPNYLSEKIDQVRAQMIISSYQNDGVIDFSWLSDLSIQSLHQVTYADDININFCCGGISKFFIPNIVSVRSKVDGNIDLGVFSVMSACGTKEYFPYPMSIWKSIPINHVRSKFNYYSRINTSLYVNKVVEKLLIRAILEHPEDGYIIVSEPQTAILPGVVYVVKNAQIVYNATVYPKNSEFTGVVGVQTFAGSGLVYLKSQLAQATEEYPYPVSADMARAIILDICVKEFGLEASQITDTENNSVDDQQKAKLAQ